MVPANGGEVRGGCEGVRVEWGAMLLAIDHHSSLDHS